MRYFLACAAFSCALLMSSSSLSLAGNKGRYVEVKDIFRHVHKTNPTLLAAREEFKETQELYPQARAGWLPTIGAEASIYATDVESSNFGGGDGATTKDIGLNIDQPIWRGGRTTAEVDKANSLISAGQALLSQREQEVFLETVMVYMSVVRDRELLALRRKNEDILLQELQAAWERMDIGDITNTDVQQAKSRLARARSERVAAFSDLEISNAEFEQVTGMKPPEKAQLSYAGFGFPKTLDGMMKYAEENNPELWMAKYEQQAAEHEIDATASEMYPQVSGFASVNRQYDPQPGIVDKTGTETIGVRAKLALYQGGAVRSKIREARSAAKRRAHEAIEQERRIKQEIRSNWSAYLAAQQQTENRKEEIEAAQEALKGVREEAKMGQRKVLDVLDADQEVIDAKAALARARYDEIIAQYALASSLGLLQAQKLGLTKDMTN